jgi:hypothetical protein
VPLATYSSDGPVAVLAPADPPANGLGRGRMREPQQRLFASGDAAEGIPALDGKRAPSFRGG